MLISTRCFFAGDSAGANITHRMAMSYGEERLSGVNLIGIILAHPFLWGKDPIANEVDGGETIRKLVETIWHCACATTSGCDDPLINPMNNPKLPSLGGNKVLVVVAGRDVLRDRGRLYCETLKNNGWGGRVEFMEAKEEAHVFSICPTLPAKMLWLCLEKLFLSYMKNDWMRFVASNYC